MAVFNNILAGAAGSGGAVGYEIERSIRLNSSDSAYLNRTPSSASNRKTWTWSGWFKRAKLGTVQGLFNAISTPGSNTNRLTAFINTNDKLYIIEDISGGTNYWAVPDQVFRDVSAWYHLVFAFDTTLSIGADRVKVYVNGNQVTSFALKETITQNQDTFVNSTIAHNIGLENSSDYPSKYFDGYLADVHFIDGQALSASYFGEFDDNNVWQPKEFAGTYGTNGFHLDFSDNSSSAALGYDAAGSNDWTVNNLTAAAVADKGFDVVTYTGTGSTQTVSGLNFQPDLVWIKSRDNARSHMVFDSVRGAQKRLLSNENVAEDNDSSTLTAFTSNGFTVNTRAEVNLNNENYVAWCWKAGGAASSNTDGTITASVSANTTYGFSIASYTGNGTSGATIGHGLSSAPGWIMVKRRNSNAFWEVFHTSLGNTKVLYLNNSDAETSSSASWNNTSPTSSVFSVGNSSGTNASGSTYIAYCWSEVPGFSKFGTWQNNNSQTGTYVELGFRPRFILLKNSDNVEKWYILDSERKPTNVSPPDTTKLQPNTDAAEGSLEASTATIDFLDSGFQIKTTNPSAGEISFQTRNYIYAAFSENPDQSVVDSLIDTPTNYEADSGNNGGNYATLNPLDSSSNYTLSNGNLTYTHSTSGHQMTSSTIAVNSGKWYVEFTPTVLGGTYMQIGITPVNTSNTTYVGNNGYGYRHDGNKQGLTTSSSYGNSYAANDVIGIAFDADGGNLYFYKNGVAQNSGTAAFTGIDTSKHWRFSVSHFNSGTGFVNFGQRPFSISSVPTGYSSLCTTNLPDPTIADGSTAFDVNVWDGDGTTNRLISTNFSPDFTWMKIISQSGQWHLLADSVRGGDKTLSTNNTNAEVTRSGFVSFDSTGFTIGDGNSNPSGGQTLVGFAWDGGTSTVSNTDGSITSSVRANPSAGFSIVSYTGTGASGTVGHGLGITPKLVIIKSRTTVSNWGVLTTAIDGSLDFLYLNLTNAASNSASSTFTSSTFDPGAGSNSNPLGESMIAYCFAPVEGYSAFGSYTGNGSNDGAFVYTGFAVRYLLTKPSSSTGDWLIWDTERDPINPNDKTLGADNSSGENSNGYDVDLLSNGFKWRQYGSSANGSNVTYIYAAFAEHPFKTARAR